MLNIIKINGRAPVPGVSTAAVAVAIKAPPPVFRVPPRPEAEPAKCGLTDIMPAFALGSTIPWPIPVSNTHPKNDIGIGSVKMKRLIHLINTSVQSKTTIQ